MAVSIDCDEAEIDIKSFDLGGVVGAGLTFPVGALRGAIGARYQHGFSDLDADAVVKNRVLSLYVGIEFGKKNQARPDRPGSWHTRSPQPVRRAGVDLSAGRRRSIDPLTDEPSPA